MKTLTTTMILVAVLSASSIAGIPATMTYQGVLTDDSATPVADGNYAITFRIYDAFTNGNLIWEETQSVLALGGVFTAVLGEVTPLAMPFDQPYWIAISVNGGSELVPRTAMTASPYSLGTAGGASNTPWQTDGDDLYYTQGPVAIGTTNPLADFHLGDGKSLLAGADTTGAGSKLMWFADLGALRAGTIRTAEAAFWDADSIGAHSFASGRGTRATGSVSTAIGGDTEARGSHSFAANSFTRALNFFATAMGSRSVADGIASTALGNHTRARAFSSVAIGRFNLGGGSPSNWNPGDPIFEIGIGADENNRTNAMTVYKDGFVRLSGSIEVNDRINFNGEYIKDGGILEIEASGDLRPALNSLYDLGTPQHRWEDVYATNGTINTSDARDKTAVEDLPYGLAEVLEMRPVRYEWIDRPHEGKKLGLIAQELQPLITEVVKSFDYQESDDERARAALDNGEQPQLQRVELDRLGVYYSDLIPVLIKAIQEQQATIEALQTRIDRLEGR